MATRPAGDLGAPPRGAPLFAPEPPPGTRDLGVISGTPKSYVPEGISGRYAATRAGGFPGPLRTQSLLEAPGLGAGCRLPAEHSRGGVAPGGSPSPTTSSAGSTLPASGRGPYCGEGAGQRPEYALRGPPVFAPMRGPRDTTWVSARIPTCVRARVSSRKAAGRDEHARGPGRPTPRSGAPYASLAAPSVSVVSRPQRLASPPVGRAGARRIGLPEVSAARRGGATCNFRSISGIDFALPPRGGARGRRGGARWSLFSFFFLSPPPPTYFTARPRRPRTLLRPTKYPHGSSRSFSGDSPRVGRRAGARQFGRLLEEPGSGPCRAPMRS